MVDRGCEKLLFSNNLLEKLVVLSLLASYAKLVEYDYALFFLLG